MEEIKIKPVISKGDLERFIKVMWKIYQNDPQWVPPLLISYRKIFNPKINPFFLHGDIKLFLAEKKGEVVGRIAAVKNDIHNREYKDKIGFFGFFECVEDKTVARLLLDRAREQLLAWGFDTMRGPASPSSNEDYGVQISGFEYPPVILTPHNRPYYYELLESYGLQSIQELYAYRLDKETVLSNTKLGKLAEQIKARNDLELVDLSKKNLKSDLHAFKELWNQAWRPNHGFVPLTNEEIEFIAEDLKDIADYNLIMFAKLKGKLVGGTIVLRDFNYIIKQMNGRLFPFNFIKFFTLKKKIKWIRVVILGVLPEYQRRGIDAVLYHEIIKRASALGCERAEASFILESNVLMNRALESIGGYIYKKYRVLEMPI